MSPLLVMLVLGIVNGRACENRKMTIASNCLYLVAIFSGLAWMAKS